MSLACYEVVTRKLLPWNSVLNEVRRSVSSTAWTVTLFINTCDVTDGEKQCNPLREVTGDVSLLPSYVSSSVEFQEEFYTAVIHVY